MTLAGHCPLERVCPAACLTGTTPLPEAVGLKLAAAEMLTLTAHADLETLAAQAVPPGLARAIEGRRRAEAQAVAVRARYDLLRARLVEVRRGLLETRSLVRALA